MNNEKKTRDFFNEWDDYHRLVSELDTYRYTTQALRGEIAGRVLDIGNGGVFNYDVGLAQEVVSVDIAEELSKRPSAALNLSFRQGEATALPVESESFDVCLLQFLIHHLAERSFSVTRERTQLCFQEAWRALRPGGRLVVIESCLPKPWELAERLTFPLFRFALARIGHPIVFQWNWQSLGVFAQHAGFENVELTRIHTGRWVIQLGCKWPTALTPIRLYKLVAHKRAY